jgi:hypothetical protein
MLEIFVMKKQTEECEDMIQQVNKANQVPERQIYFCRARECGKEYFYKKARDNHEVTKHPEVASLSDEIPSKNSEESSENDTKEDHIYNYACLRLRLGMLLRNFCDAVKEGDVVRILRCWKYLLLIFKAHNHTKYGLAALHLFAKTKAMLTAQQAHSLVWDRTISNKGGLGKNISLDLRLEHIVCLLKEMISNLGVNLTSQAASRCSKAVMPVEKLLLAVDGELEVKRPSGRHTVTRSQTDYENIVKELNDQGKVFSCEAGRECHCFGKFKSTA